MESRQRRLQIIIATSNQGKVREIENAFADLPIELLSLKALEKELPEAVEDGATFLENSRIKAAHYSKLTGYPCLADDSGLEVEALAGRPGVYSARYAGENATYEDNNKKIVEELKAKGLVASKGAYQCVLTFNDGKGEIFSVQGTCSGEIRIEGRGQGGFGYDPYFYIGERSMAEMSLAEKQGISHRGEAIKKMGILLREYLDENRHNK